MWIDEEERHRRHENEAAELELEQEAADHRREKWTSAAALEAASPKGSPTLDQRPPPLRACATPPRTPDEATP